MVGDSLLLPCFYLRRLHMVVHLNGDIDEGALEKRLLIRADRSRKKKGTVRTRIWCKRCRHQIPDTRRIDAVFCSVACCNSYHWEQRREMEKEIRQAKRQLRTISLCECGVEIDTRFRPGPVPTQCQRCRARDNQRRYRAKKAASLT